MHLRRLLLLSSALATLGLAALSDEGGQQDVPQPEQTGAEAEADAGDTGDARDARADAELYFRSDVLRVLELRCFRCHGPQAQRLRGGLSLASREAVLAGGLSGPAAVPGDPDASLVVRAVRYTDLDLAMPPAEKLLDSEVEVLERWVAEGLVWPADASTTSDPSGLAPVAFELPASAPQFDAESLHFFETEIRPLLVDNCFACHGPQVEHPKNDLRLAGWMSLVRGGARGAALIPGDVDASLIARAVRYDDSDLRMPPTGKLAEEDIERLERWIAMGAPWTPGADLAQLVSHEGVDYEQGRQWWSFRPVVAAPVPAPQLADAELADAELGDALDAFVLQRLAEQGLEPNARASERELVRRVYHDLIGLPASAAEIAAYEADDDPHKWAKLVDRLLARPEYGERWARHWLDVVRYAETNGYERDTLKPYAWRYRDWVVDALNEDLPYDRFLALQLAGDELVEEGMSAAQAAAQRIATGFYRLGPWDDEPGDKQQAVFDEYDDVVRTIGEGMLGITLACARCHDHKFDPVSQEDYYSVLAFVRGVRPFELPSFSIDSPVLQPLVKTPAAIASWEAERAEVIATLNADLGELLEVGRRSVRESRRAALTAQQKAALAKALATPAGQRTAADQQLVRQQQKVPDAQAFRALDPDQTLQAQRMRLESALLAESFEGQLDWALVATEAGPELPETRVLIRGQATSPGPPAAPRFPPALCRDDESARPGPFTATAHSAGSRRALAEWISSSENPLTARVLVNRVWQQHFGRGLVPTPNDFGRSGQPPSHPALLDHLAARFMAEGWSLKQLHRWILNSSTWQRDSRAANAKALALDPANELLWRQNPRRLEAEALRDAILSVSGALNLERGGPSFFPRLSRDALAGASRPGAGWGVSSDEQLARRSVYAFVKRTLILPFFATFDYTTVSLPVGKRQETNLAAQHMALLNSGFANREAARFALSLASELPASADADESELRAARIARAFERALARTPSADEQQLAERYVAELAAETAPGRDRPGEPLGLVPRVPLRLAEDFLPLLAGEDMLFGPRVGWHYLAGRWGEPYNMTLEQDRDCGPIAVLDGDVFDRALFEGLIELGPGCERAGLVFALGERADGSWHGVEVALEPVHERLRVLYRAPAETWRSEDEVLLELGRAALPEGATAGRRLRLEVSFDPDGVVIDIDPEPDQGATEPLLHVQFENALSGEHPPPGAGAFGLRVVGDALLLHEGRLTTNQGPQALRPDDPGSPELVALESLCLTLFDLNEFLYVD